tara:strand:- start:306 stop:983 length:678 start_codon:yes stop_codon:yes gene_type:complete
MNTELTISSLYLFCFQIILFIVKKHSILSNRDNIHIASKITSCINAGLAVISSYLYIIGYTDIKDVANYLIIMRGYLIFDCANISYYSNYFELKSTLLHHISLFFITYIDLQYKQNAYYVARGLMGEFTNFSLYFGWFLLKKNLGQSKLFKLNAYVLIILWFILRSLNFTHLTWHILTNKYGYSEKTTIFILSCLNNFWFYKLAKKGIEMKKTNKITFTKEEKDY